MNKLYRKVLVRLVDEGMPVHFPEFALDKFDKNPMRRPANREFVWQALPDMRIYISVTPHPGGRDDFQCEIWWSRLGRYPEPVAKIYRPEHYAEDEGWVVLNECGDLPFAWKIERVDVPPPASLAEECDDYRGLTEAEAVRLIAPLVEQLFAALTRYGRPIMRDLVAARTEGA